MVLLGGGTVVLQIPPLSLHGLRLERAEPPPKAATGALNGAARYPHSPGPGNAPSAALWRLMSALGCRILASADAIDAPRLRNQALGRGAKPPKRQRSQMRRIPLHDQGERGRQVSPARCAAE